MIARNPSIVLLLSYIFVVVHALVGHHVSPLCRKRKRSTSIPTIRAPIISLKSSSSDDNAGKIQFEPSVVMDDILKGNATAASLAVTELMNVRGTEQMEEYLTEMMPPEKSGIPLWARLPLTKFSRRARQLRLRKVLEISTPIVDGNDDDKNEFQDDDESKSRRARRSLFILIRDMATANDENGTIDISKMLVIARKGAKDENVSFEDMLQRTPDLETPTYEVLKTSSKGFEVRRYEQFSVCSVTMKDLKSPGSSDEESVAKLSNPQLSGATSFGALAGYLFGKNEEGKEMKMTTPVLTVGEEDSRTMSFVLPSSYWDENDLSAAPTPLRNSAVKVTSVPGGERAVLAFGGFGRKADVSFRKRKLYDLLNSDEEWEAIKDAPITLAQYNDPFTPPWKRRNEVSVAVVKKLK